MTDNYDFIFAKSPFEPSDDIDSVVYDQFFRQDGSFGFAFIVSQSAASLIPRNQYKLLANGD